MKRFFIITIALIILLIGGTFAYAKVFRPSINSSHKEDTVVPTTTIAPEPPKPIVTHIQTPTPVKAVYMSSWVAASPKPYQHVLELIEKTEINAVVLDIKDATGRISFLTDESLVQQTGSPENRIKDIVGLIQQLHAKNIYVIGRISTFQDLYLTKVKPGWAITRKSDGTVWKDRKGLSFLDPANTDVWEYTRALAQASYNVGFDEINFDYIRYPSDGNVKDINYKLAEGQTRADNMEKFYAFLYQRLHIESSIPISADLFGLTTSEKTDMGIGQILERALPYFNFIGPMVYPSHYAKGEYGVAKPAENPYTIVLRAMQDAEKKITALKNDPNLPQEFKDRVSFQQIRPWIQDFDMGAIYDKEKVQAQMKAVYDSGLTSWMMWDPSNKYTPEAYALE